MAWRWASEIGVFTIATDPASGRWGLFLEGYGRVATYPSPAGAAEEFAAKVTGCDEWDLSAEPGPEDLSDWLCLG
jgi:hypothetical protein